MKLFTFSIILTIIILVVLMFILGYETGKGNKNDYIKYYNEYKQEWEKTIEFIKIYGSNNPVFIKLPTEEIIILRYYPDSHVFEWNEKWPITDTTQILNRYGLRKGN